ncbi:MAG: glutamate--cysteine ligase, partial [Alphaproteobacteria bacterium]
MARDVSDLTPITSRDELVSWIEKGVKPKSKFLIGTEHEKFPFYVADRRPVPYEGRNGIRALLEGMQAMLGWEPIMEGEHIIGMADVTGGGAISLEPGGQFELSGAPLASIHQTCSEIHAHLAQVREIGEPLGIRFLALGMSPVWTRAETPAMPKRRYEIMTAYMQRVGLMGLDMMYRTSTVQVNLDFASEADMVKKLRVSLALQPIATAIFANSPFTNGRTNGFLSMRSEVWKHTDLDRTGMIPFAFESGMGFERYVDYALDVPLYFVKRGDTYHDVSGSSFHDLMAGKLPQLPGVFATMSDWVNHVGTLFPEVRLKRYLEMRGADAGPTARLAALSAYWVGLLYDETALDAAWDLVKDWTLEERQALRDSVPRQALATPFRNTNVREIARQTLDI